MWQKGAPLVQPLPLATYQGRAPPPTIHLSLPSPQVARGRPPWRRVQFSCCARAEEVRPLELTSAPCGQQSESLPVSLPVMPL